MNILQSKIEQFNCLKILLESSQKHLKELGLDKTPLDDSIKSEHLKIASDLFEPKEENNLLPLVVFSYEENMNHITGHSLYPQLEYFKDNNHIKIKDNNQELIDNTLLSTLNENKNFLSLIAEVSLKDLLELSQENISLNKKLLERIENIEQEKHLSFFTDHLKMNTLWEGFLENNDFSVSINYKYDGSIVSSSPSM